MHVDFQGSHWIFHPSLTSYTSSCSVAKSQTLLGCVWQLWSRNILHLTCVCHYCIEMAFLGNQNVQLFQVHELLMVG